MATIFVSSGIATVNTATTDNYIVFGSGELDVQSGGLVLGFIEVSDPNRGALPGGVRVASGGEVTDTIVASDGELDILGSSIDAVVSGGLLVDGGFDEASTVTAGGFLDVVSGGRAFADTIGGGGLAEVESGGVETGDVVAGGTLDLDSGAICSGATFEGTGGTLEIIGSSTLTAGAISAFTPGNTIDLVSVPYDPTGNATLRPVEDGSVLTVTEGGQTFLVSLGPTVGETFKLAPDRSGGTDILAHSATDVSDFSGGGKSHVLWRNGSNAALADWSMSGSVIQSSSSPIQGGNVIQPDSSWSIAGVGDFIGNGKSDILWRQSSTGTLAEWQMNGSTIASSTVLAASPDASWSVAGIGDFNGDGKSDILWRNSATNQLVGWQMNGSQITSLSIAAAPDSSWNIVGIGDFSGRGSSDILWRQSTTNTLVEWGMNGGGIAFSTELAATPDSTWSVAGIGDFNGDGKSDILWRQSTTGTLAEWDMNGGTIASSQTLAAAPDSSWVIAAIGDFNGDGKSDIMWQHNDGMLAEWLMNGATISSSNPTFQGGNVSVTTDWQAQSKPTDFG